MVISKTTLAIELSKLNVFLKANAKLEQYPTDSEIAGDMLWNAYMLGDVEDKRILDLGAGTGILSIGAAFLGAGSITLIDADKDALEIAERSIEEYSRKEYIEKDAFTVLNRNIKDDKLAEDLLIEGKYDIVIENPPFGTRDKHIDREFLKLAFKLSDVVYSFHKTATVEYLIGFAEKNGFSLTHKFGYKFPLKQTMNYHKKNIHRIDVCCLRFERK